MWKRMNNTAISARQCATFAVKPPRHHQSFILPDGRTLGFAEYGSATGQPVFFLHGFPENRLGAMVFDQAAQRHDIRIVSPDRPGFGLSSPHPGRRIVDHVADVQGLAEHLNIPSFAVLGVSGGGPYALACAQKIPEKLTGVGLMCSATPWEAEHGRTFPPGVGRSGNTLLRRSMASAFRSSPVLTGKALDVFIATVRFVLSLPFVTRRFEAGLTADKSLLDQSLSPQAQWQRVTEAMLEGFSQGSSATVEEGRLLIAPWDIDFRDITLPVLIWHGEQDVNTPINGVKYMASELPKASLKIYPATHYTIVQHVDDIFADLQQVISSHGFTDREQGHEPG